MRLEVHSDTTGKERYELTEVHSELNPPTSFGNGYYRLITNIYKKKVQVYFYKFQSSLPASNAYDYPEIIPALRLQNPEKEFPPYDEELAGQLDLFDGICSLSEKFLPYHRVEIGIDKILMMAENKASHDEIVSAVRDTKSYLKKILILPGETVFTKCLVEAMEQVSTPTKLHVQTEEEETNAFCCYYCSREDNFPSFSFFQTDQSGDKVKAACVGLDIDCLYGAVEESKKHDEKKAKYQLLACMLKVATWLGYVCVHEGNLFKKITIYGVLVKFDGTNPVLYVLNMDFIEQRSKFYEWKADMTIGEALMRIVQALKEREPWKLIL